MFWCWSGGTAGARKSIGLKILLESSGTCIVGLVFKVSTVAQVDCSSSLSASNFLPIAFLKVCFVSPISPS